MVLLTIALETTVSILKVCKAALDIFPVPGLSAVVDILIALAVKVKALRTNQQAVQELAEELLGLSMAVDGAMRRARTCSTLLSLTLGSRTQTQSDPCKQKSPLQGRNELLQSQIEHLTAEAAKLQKGSSLRRLLRSNQDLRIIRHLRTEAKRILTEFNVSLSLDLCWKG
ncbi:hypothetical protein BN946_scf185028.g9 [Trametes cinnabarina]|uniref:Uncharacterized protein n=1 Tax=Pycnoporus cinnabarinus TaxID=5643 RepID=A0A060SW96_PYCCI|nr:hypothetical protein BN946_scf185028.g9 [Trametes cinnabarina]